MSEQQHNFDTDVSRLLDIVANALYSNKDVFLRELISNAADACDRLRYEAISKPELTKNSAAFHVRIQIDPEARTIRVSDNGIGMNRDDLIENLGTIARSGTAAVMDQIGQQSGDDKLNLIGQFGVGFYASFMIAKSVDVISQKAGKDDHWFWQSDGQTGFTVREATDEEKTKLSDLHGTSILLHLKDDLFDILLEDKLKEIVQTYSDHIDIPVYIGSAKEDEQPVNAASALWTRPKSDITEEQYKEFYNHIGHGFDEPVLTSHWKAEGVIEYSALLFVPTMRPWDLYDPGRKHAVRLYVKRVYITDQLETLIYPWLRFVRGVVDSEDLPLNISREMLQNNPVVEKIRRGVTKRILTDLHKLSESDTAAFDSFWHQFGMVLKEGLYDAVEHRPDLFKICRFYSSHKDGKLFSLDDYVSRMKDGQNAIYYMTGDKVELLQNSPQLEGFKARGIEVLFMTDTVDSFWLQMVSDYQDKNFVSITKGHVDLTQYDEKADATASEDADSKDDTDNNPDDKTEILITAIKDALKDDVANVRWSNRLTSSPVCLVAAENGVDMHMEKYLKIQQQYDPQSQRVLEINKDHALIKRLSILAAENDNADDLKDAAQLLLDQARIIEGESLPDPAGFARRMSNFMERGLAA